MSDSGQGVKKRGPQSCGFTATDHKELGILTRKNREAVQ